MQDVLAGLDETIGRLLAVLDGRSGSGRYVVAFSADHGVATHPRATRREGTAAGRVAIDG